MSATAPPRSVDGDAAARGAKVRRSAWLLGWLAAAFYVGFILWNVLRGSLPV